MNSQEKKQRGYLAPFILALAVVPLVCFIHSYDSGLQKYSWISVQEEMYDFFLYYKSRFLMILCAILCIYMIYRFCISKIRIEKEAWILSICLGAFLLFSLVSAFLAEDASYAFWGGYEQWEGFFVLLSYGILFCFAYLFVNGEDNIRFIFICLSMGALLVGLLGTFQAFGLDYTNTDGMHAVLTSLEPATRNTEYQLAFEKGMAYSTLYNPNYVGTYAALLFPVLVGAAIWSKRVWQKIAAGIGAVCLLISVYASGSLTGVIGIFAAAVVFLIFLLPHWKKHKVAGGIVAGCFAAIIIVAVVIKPQVLSGMLNRLTESAEVNETHVIEYMRLKDNALNITSKSGKKITMAVQFDGSFHFEFPDEKNAPQSSQYNAADNSMSVAITDTEVLSVTSQVQKTEDGDIPVMILSAEGNRFTFLWNQGKLLFYNSLGKIAKLREIDHVGFENNMRFATGRGYIWSRTFPLLPKHILAGCGQDNFIYDYPNDDYVGKQNYGFENQVMSKPHNMYLQIWVQDGLIALLGFLGLVILYIIDCFRVYFSGNTKGFMAGMGFFTFLGIVGYMVVGLAADSTVTVAPVFWGLLGLGFVLNRNCRLKKKE